MRIIKILILILIFFKLPLNSAAQQDIQEEEMKIVSVRVQVRVFEQGKLVKNLTKEDFKIFEGDEEQEVEYFYKVGNKIGKHDIQISTNQGNQLKPRYFVLVFRIFNFNQQLKNGINVFFNNMIKEGDEVLIFANNKTLYFKTPYKTKVQSKRILTEVLKDQAHRANIRLLGYLYEIQRELSQEILQDLITIDANFFAPKVILFLEKYLDEWRFYRKNYLIPDTNKYYNFANHLQKIKKQKWVINFYQIELFPKLKLAGRIKRELDNLIGQLETQQFFVYARQIKKLLNKIDQELNVVAEFPVEELSKLFYKVNTTFHSIFMNINKDAASEHFEFKRVSSDLENCFRRITKDTGGELMVTNNISSALHKISDHEDYYYVLAYSPKDNEKVGKIKIKMINPIYQANYDNNQRKDYINDFLKKQRERNPIITIDNMVFTDKTFSFDITNFFKLELKKREKIQKGNIIVKIKINNQMNEIVYNDIKAINPKKEIVNVSVSFDWLEKGKYYITVDVLDNVSNKAAMEFLQTEIK